MSENTDETFILSLATLAEGLPALTPAAGATLAEAGSVCLENQNHALSCRLSVRQPEETSYILERLEVTEQMRRCHNDLQDATEFGACGIAILTVCRLTGWTIIERSRKGTGHDYWLGIVDERFMFQKKARMEVSGILRGDESIVDSRVRQKMEQTRVSDGNHPVYVLVVEFSQPFVKVVQR